MITEEQQHLNTIARLEARVKDLPTQPDPFATFKANAEFVRALLEGKPLRWRMSHVENWIKFNGQHHVSLLNDPKAILEVCTPTYRPFTWAELVAMAKDLPVEVRLRKEGNKLLVVGICYFGKIMLSFKETGEAWSMLAEDAFNNLTYPDGTPFGKVVEGEKT